MEGISGCPSDRQHIMPEGVSLMSKVGKSASTYARYKFSRPKAGLFFVGCRRFKDMGEGTARGTYGDRKAEDSKLMVKDLEGFIDVSFPGIIYEREDAENAIKRFIADDVDFVIVQFLSWAEDFSWVRFMRDLPKIPVLFTRPVKSKMAFDNTYEEDDFVEYLASGGLVGSLVASGTIPRIGRPNVSVVVDTIENIYEKIKIYSIAAKAGSVLKKSRFAMLSGFNELMWSTYVDPYNFFIKAGPEMKFLSYTDLVEEMSMISEDEAVSYMNMLKGKYSVDGDIDSKKFLESVRASIGMANLTGRRQIDALVLNDVDAALFKLIGLRPGFYHERFNADLSVVVPEGDAGGALITYVLKLMSRKNVNFIEPFHIEEGKGTFDGGHAGPNDHTDPDWAGNVKIAPDVRFAKTAYKYAGAPFAWYRISPGRKTMAHISESNGRYKLVCTMVDSLEGGQFITSYSHGVFRPDVPVKQLFEKIISIGTTQHFAVVDGCYKEHLKYFASIMDFDFYDITHEQIRTI